MAISISEFLPTNRQKTFLRTNSFGLPNISIKWLFPLLREQGRNIESKFEKERDLL